MGSVACRFDQIRVQKTLSHEIFHSLHHNVYYGKREAEPYTLAQVATGQTNGGALTFLDAAHGTGHRPIVATAPVVSYAYAPHHVYYGKRSAEPYTLAQVATGQTNGGVITSVGGLPVVPHHVPVAVPATYVAVPALHHGVYYGKR